MLILFIVAISIYQLQINLSTKTFKIIEINMKNQVKIWTNLFIFYPTIDYSLKLIIIGVLFDSHFPDYFLTILIKDTKY